MGLNSARTANSLTPLTITSIFAAFSINKDAKVARGRISMKEDEALILVMGSVLQFPEASTVDGDGFLILML